MRATLDYVREKFDYYNQLCFEGKLPHPELAINSRYQSLGLTCTERRKEVDGTTKECFRIEISNRMDLPEVEYIDTIVHEMIHYYIGYNHIKDDSPHGHIFRAKMKEITEQYGIQITVDFTEDEEAAIARRLDKYQYVCVLEMEDGTYCSAVVIRNKVFEWWKKCAEMQGVRETKWYISNRAIFEQFPMRVNPYFVSVEANKMLHYLTGAVELENTGTTIKPKD